MKRGWVVSPTYREMIEGVKAIRENAGVTQRELARRLGKPPSFVNKIELLERRLDLLEFIAIAEALNTPAETAIGQIRTRLPTAIVI